MSNGHNGKSSSKIRSWFFVIIVLVIIIVVGSVVVNRLRQSLIQVNEVAATDELKSMSKKFEIFRKKKYGVSSETYPVGNDANLPNDGKYCGLYFELKEPPDMIIALIGEATACADLRANGSTDIKEGEGAYLYPSSDMTGYSLAYKQKVTFKMAPKQGYWFGLMQYFDGESGLQAYDMSYSKDHYGIVALPAKYGWTGKKVFIMDERGVIYWKDFRESKYVANFPGLDPTKVGWQCLD